MTPNPPKPIATKQPTPIVPPKRRKNTVVWVIVLGGILLAGYIWWRSHYGDTAKLAGGRPGGGRGPGFGPQPVAVRTVVQGDIHIYLNALGTVTPLSTVAVRTQINGQLMQLNFTEGQLVQKGDLLAIIDPRPYEVALKQAEAQLTQAQAQLNSSKLDLERYETLVKQDSISSQQLDSQRALVQQRDGGVASADAAMASAKLNLAYCHIVAPVSGRTGIRQVDIGNYVQTGDANGIVVITQQKPINTVFTLPEDQVPEVIKRTRAGVKLPVELYDRGQKNKLSTGVLTTIDNQVDTSTGTVKMKAEFVNADESLFPNQFVNVRVLVDTEKGATVIPTSAIERGSQGTYVYAVNADQTVSSRIVVMGPIEGESAAVVSGLTVGDQVVVDGADRLRDGMRVIVQGENPPAAQQGERKRGNRPPPPSS